MSDLAVQKNALPAMQMDEAELMNVLRNSLYVGAKDESIKMAVAYCNAAGLDIMQKPVHLVPMWDAKAGQMRDVVMPGIGLYRTQAARSGAYAGVTDPEFGPDVTESLGGLGITYPAWCRIAVKRRLPSGEIVEFAATERWKENYAQKGGKEKSIAPNAMWTRRPYAQLAKCAEAQALRKAFPEFGSQPTADEMDGKEIDMGTIDRETGEVKRAEPPAPPPTYTQEQFDANKDAWRDAIASGKTTADRIVAMVSSKYVLSEEHAAAIRDLTVVDAEFVNDMEGAEQ